MYTEYIKVKKWYDNNVASYMDRSALLLKNQLKYFVAQMPNRGNILDHGCGPGHDTEYFAAKGFLAVGVDFSLAMVKYARQHRKGGTFKKIDILKLDKYFKENYFDGVWSSSSITHLKKSDIVKALKQIRFVVAPQSPIIIIVKRKIKRKEIIREIQFNEFFKKDILNYCKESGLYVKKIQIFNVFKSEWFFIHAFKN
jgi:ubiquinone/menaquinone biosynthesis C-methylase UbiE